jgi:hypothetical protein
MNTTTNAQREKAFVLREGIECSLHELKRLALSLVSLQRSLERARDVLLDDASDDESKAVQS